MLHRQHEEEVREEDEGLTLAPNIGTILDSARVVDGKVSLTSLPLPMLVELHGALVKAVAPATPSTR